MSVLNNIRLELLEKEVIMQGHFKLTSGLHSDLYVQKDRIWAYPDLRDNIIEGLFAKLERFVVGFPNIVITGPAQAGIPWAAILADRFNRPFAYCEKDDFGMDFKRGFSSLIKGKSVVIVEDIVTTGFSLHQTVAAVYACEGWVDRAVCIWDRSRGKAEIQCDFHFPLYSLINERVQSWTADKCPLCMEGMSLDDPKK
jgi:orotate phosphoribosyltransferase